MIAGNDIARRLLFVYYAATLVFLLLDYVAGINVRLSFLEALPAARAGYYGVCFLCFALMIWRPAWTVLISAFEGLVTIVALTLAIGVRIFVISDEMIDTGRGFVTPQEIWNYLLSGGAAYIAWFRGIRQLNAGKIHDIQ